MTASSGLGERDQSTNLVINTTRRNVLALSALGLMSSRARSATVPAGQLTYGVHVSLAPTWFDPAETNGLVTPFMLLYAMQDAMVKAMPGQLMTPCLAQSWSATEDGLNYDFVLRDGAKFHNGEPVTADDVKFSFERYHGSDHVTLKSRVEAIETPDPRHVRFRLKQPWPDFLTFYCGSTGAGWVVPRKYVEQVGDDGFRRAPIGAGPYKFASFNPGVELVLEAFEGYWRKTPAVKRLVLKVIPDEATRLAALKRNEIDVAYSIRGELADELRSTPGLTLKPVVLQGTFWIYFPGQWDPKSPWHDVRVRQAANLAIDRKSINDALTLGFSHITGSLVPDIFEFYWPPPAPQYDPIQARQLLAEAGYKNGFDAGSYTCDSSYANLGEAVLNNLQQVGIHAKLRPIERAAFAKGYADKAYKDIIQSGSAAFGNAATRMESYFVKGGAFSYGSYPDIDALYQQQATELDHRRRGALLQTMQQLVRDKAIYAPIWQLAFINGIGPRVAESGFGSIPGFPYTAPYEDLLLKNT